MAVPLSLEAVWLPVAAHIRWPSTTGRRVAASALLCDVRLAEHFLAVEQVMEDIIGDTPDERDNFVVRCLIHI